MGTIGNSIDTKLLTIAGRQRSPCVFVEDIADTEVIELYANLAYHHTAAVAALEIELTRGAFLYLIHNINSAILSIRLGDRLYLLFLEVT